MRCVVDLTAQALEQLMGQVWMNGLFFADPRHELIWAHQNPTGFITVSVRAGMFVNDFQWHARSGCGICQHLRVG
jgi:hypothetical protein